jgi:CRISPR-associated endoribonuclease Cas6
MRIKMVFQLEKPELDIEYRRAILSLLKKSFQQASETVYKKLYETGTTMKPFTFGVYLEKPEFREDTVLLQSREITLNFSTSETKLGIYFYNFLVKNRFVPFPLAKGNSLSRPRFRLVKELPITSSEIVFKTLTPFLVRDHNRDEGKDVYLAKEDPNFVSQLEWSLGNMIEVMMERKEGVKVEPVKLSEKIPIKHYGQRLDGYKGIIKMTGSPEVLEFIYRCGCGSRRSEGFGYLEVVG